MFDLPAAAVSEVGWDLDLPACIVEPPAEHEIDAMHDVGEPTSNAVGAAEGHAGDRPWQVGLIVGPSGSGKSTIARELFGAYAVNDAPTWPADRAIVDAFPESRSIREITDALSAVGLASPPAWLRPHHVLSTGQRFRADMARRLLDPDRNLIVVDEFTSVVDRTVARTVSHCVARAVRRRRELRFVAVSCHYDIIDWLQPEWILDMADGAFNWRSVQPRPAIELEVHRVHHRAWSLFRAHHYLTGSHLTSAKCFAMFLEDRPVAWLSFNVFPGRFGRRLMHFHRLVVLPDHQGLGLAMRFLNLLAAMLKAVGCRSRTPTSHPALRSALARSPEWQLTRPPNLGRKTRARRPGLPGWHDVPARRRVAMFEYTGPPWPDRAEAEAMVGA